MERRLRWVWWGVLVVLVLIAAWKLFLPHGTKAYLEKSSGGREIVVYVTGAVEKPGLVRLPLDARLDDALKQVRLLPEANLDVMNPAERLKDGQKISVSFRLGTELANTVGNSSNLSGTSSGRSLSTQPGTLPTKSAVTPPGTSSGASTPSGSSMVSSGSVSNPSGVTGKININTASAAELDKLPGIGPALAERIIQYRTENGLFVKPEDLQAVSGIGPKTYEKMATQVTVGP
ncbi:MAG: helix-hairpin-helix domain-containing protein [Desulfitobacteriaceae bacterium]